MLSSFRNLSKSKAGTVILLLFLVAIVASFAVADIGNVRSGSGTASGGAVASIGSQDLTERDISRTMERQLVRLRSQNPEAQMSDLIEDYDTIVAMLLQERAITAFADETGMRLSRRLVDAEIAQLPGVNGLDGKFSENAYRSFLSQQRLTDTELRRDLSNAVIQRLMLTPVAAGSRIASGMAAPYAAMLLEQRYGEIAVVPAAQYRAGPPPTDQQLAAFYARNRARYTMPERRVLRYAVIGPELVAAVAASDAEIASYYAANQAIYGGKQQRVISQAVVPDKAAAAAIAERARSGKSFVEAVAPAGLGAADVSVGPQTRGEFAALAGEQVAAAAFAAKAEAIVGPLQSELGWHVVRIDAVRDQPGRSLAEARAEIAARLDADKRKDALTDIVTRIEDEIADGASFAETVAKNRLELVETPPLSASGTAPDPAYQPPADARALLATAFEVSPDDDPTVESLPGNTGYALLAIGEVIPAAAPPLAKIREQVASDWLDRRAVLRAAKVADAIAAKAKGKQSLADAVRSAGRGLPPARPISARRIDLTQLEGKVPPPLRTLFSLPVGAARRVAAAGAGFFIVKVNRIVPGDARAQPALIGRTQAAFAQVAGREYAEQFVTAIQSELGIRSDPQALARVKRQLAGNAQ